MASATFDLPALLVSDPVTSAKGAKTSALSYGGKPVVWQPEPQAVAYEPSSYQNEDSTRVNLVMRATPGVVDVLQELDEYLVKFCTDHSLRLFGRDMTQEEVQLRYTPCLKRSEKGYDPTFKVKIATEGRGKLKCWDGARNLREAPRSWIGCSAQPLVTVRCLWIMPKSFGCLFECSDVLVDEAGPQCPF